MKVRLILKEKLSNARCGFSNPVYVFWLEQVMVEDEDQLLKAICFSTSESSQKVWFPKLIREDGGIILDRRR